MKLILLFSVLLIGAVNARSTWAFPKLECKNNEIFELLSASEPSCENPNPEAHCCEYFVCRCDRESGFLRNTTTGECVKGTDCDPPVIICGEKESIDPCTLGCEPSCDNPEPTNCTQKCVSDCQCNKGFLRRGDNKCVRETQCELPPACPENEFWNDCHKPCEERKCSVLTEDGFHKKRFSICRSPCTKACTCNEGLFRNHDGRCVKEADCRPPGYECKGNETFTERKSNCEASCRTPNSFLCSDDRETGCQCTDGFLRNPKGECVKEEDCPYEDPKNKCKSLDCGLDNQCFVHEGKPVCIPSDDLDICFGFPCPYGSSCEIVNDRPRCLAKTCDKIRCGTSEECDEVRYENEANGTMKPLCYKIGGNGFLFSFTKVCWVTPCPEVSTYVLHEPRCTEPRCDPIAKLESLEAQALEGKQCRKNEIFSTCKTSCSDTNCNEKPEVCPEECNDSGCVCQEGFFRDRFGDCVTQIDCDIQKEHMQRLLWESDN